MFDENESLKRDAVFSVGRVVSVEGRKIRISVDKLKNNAHLLYQGEIVRNIAVGSFIKIAKGFGELVASVDGEFIREERKASGNYKRNVDNLVRELEVSLVGYFEKDQFHRGVREMPLLDNECFILSEREFRAIHSFADTKTPTIPLGVLAMEPTQPVSIGVDKIFASHIGIFGNTGSGKSYTLAKIYHELFKRYGTQPGFADRSQFVLLDFNGEYVNREPDGDDAHGASVITDDSFKKEYQLSTRTTTGDRLPLPSSAVNDPLFWSILLGATEKTQAPFVSRVLRGDFWDRLLPNSSSLLAVIANTVAKATKSTDPLTDRLLPHSILEEIEECLGDTVSSSFKTMVREFKVNLNYHNQNRNYFWEGSPRKWSSDSNWEDFIADKIKGVTQDFSAVTDVDLVRFKLVLQFYKDVVGGFVNREHIGPLIKRLHSQIYGIKRLITVSKDNAASKPLTVVSLRDVNLEMRKVIPMILCRHLYETKKISDPSNERHLNLIIDEAHNILSLDSSRENEAWRDYRLETFEEIVKEGRKFGVFLTIASQRPHDISPTIISQLHNYFLHRLVNDLDIRAIEKAVSYLDRVSFESMPILPTGTSILSGVATQIPVMVSVGEVEPRYAPNSRTMSITTAWSTPLHQPDIKAN